MTTITIGSEEELEEHMADLDPAAEEVFELARIGLRAHLRATRDVKIGVPATADVKDDHSRCILIGEGTNLMKLGHGDIAIASTPEKVPSGGVRFTSMLLRETGEIDFNGRVVGSDKEAVDGFRAFVQSLISETFHLRFPRPRTWVRLGETTPSGKTLFLCTECGRVSCFPDKKCPPRRCSGSLLSDFTGFPLQLAPEEFEALQEALHQYVENSQDCEEADVPLLPHAERILDRMNCVIAHLAGDDGGGHG